MRNHDIINQKCQKKPKSLLVVVFTDYVFYISSVLLELIHTYVRCFIKYF